MRGYIDDEFDWSKILLTENKQFKNMEKSAWFMSSEDPTVLSLTIRGALMMYVPFILEIAREFNLPLTQNIVTEFITKGSLVFAFLMIAYGLIRKAKNLLSK